MDNQLQTARNAPIEMTSSDFRTLGHQLVDDIADFMETLPNRPVAPGQSPSEIRDALDSQKPLPETGINNEQLLKEATRLLFNYSTFNGHPRFLAYITSSARPIRRVGRFAGCCL